MKLQLISDLHTEFYQGPKHALRNVVLAPGLDFLVVAGDSVVFSRQSEQEVNPVFKFFSEHARHVLWIEGNHEYYYSRGFEQLENEMAEYAGRYVNVHWLRNTELLLDGVHFFGGCMWFPNSDGHNSLYKREISDFELIRDLDDWVYERNRDFGNRAQNLIHARTIVITHHLPHQHSVPQIFRSSQSCRFFVSDQTNLIEKKQPRLWLHGHTHEPCDYLLDNTRVICNPYGYPGERRDAAFPQVVLDV